MCHLKKLSVREKNLKNNLGSRTADKVKEEGWSSRSSGLTMQSQNQEAKPTGAESPGVKRGSSIHRQQDLLTAHGSCSKGRRCPPRRHPCPQHGAWAASGQILALASSLKTIKGSEPTAIWGINSALSTGVWSRRGGKTLVPQGGQGTSLLEPSWDSWDHLEETGGTRVQTEC